jgi:hypothetical protein
MLHGDLSVTESNSKSGPALLVGSAFAGSASAKRPDCTEAPIQPESQPKKKP